MAQNIIDPLIINLLEVPQQGLEYQYNQLHPEMKAALKDLIADNDFNIRIHLSPSGGVFLLTGHVKTQLNLACYRCALDFKFPIDEVINELLIVESVRPRGSRSARTHLGSENGRNHLNPSLSSVTTISTPVFDVSATIHEIIALAEPLQPKGKPDCNESCENLLEAYRNGWLPPPVSDLFEATKDKEQQAQAEVKNKPFAVLRDLKLNR